MRLSAMVLTPNFEEEFLPVMDQAAFGRALNRRCAAVLSAGFVLTALVAPASASWAAQDTAATGGSDTASGAKAAPRNATAKVKRRFDQTYRLWNSELDRYVVDGNVRYGLWQKHQEGLKRFLKQVEALSEKEYDSFSREEKLAFWLNVYNALIVKTVLDHYPISGKIAQYPKDSFRQIPNDWEAEKFKVMGKDINLYQIEHEKIRRDLSDPRTHFAVVCASRSCGKLFSNPYQGKDLDKQLNEAAQRFLSDSKNIELDPENGVFRVSKIFSWFTLDFASHGSTKPVFPPPGDEEIVAAFIRPYLKEAEQKKLFLILKNLKQVNFDYLPYDWSLNDTATARSNQ